MICTRWPSRPPRLMVQCGGTLGIPINVGFINFTLNNIYAYQFKAPRHAHVYMPPQTAPSLSKKIYCIPFPAKPLSKPILFVDCISRNYLQWLTNQGIHVFFPILYFSECVGNESPMLLTLGSNFEKTHTYRIWNTSIPLDSNHMFCRYGCDLHLKIFRSYFRRGKTWGVSPRDLTYCSHKSVCIVTTNPGGSVLIAFISCYFQFRPVNVSILYLRCQYHARSESRFACFSQCYVTWCPLTTGIVTSQFPPRDAALATRHLTHFILACLNYAGLIPNV